MDANQTRFQLVFGEADWFGDTAPSSSSGVALEWRASDATVGLPQKLFVFPVAPSTAALTAADRRGAGQDRYGNYYWIAPARDEILFLAPGQLQSRHFWSASDLTMLSCTSGIGTFTALSPMPAKSYAMGGLTVTTDHYLLVGLTQPAGLLLFDLYPGGAPLEFRWPARVAFEPFALTAAPDGGAWILDRVNRCYWGLDPWFRVLAPLGLAMTAASTSGFKPVFGSAGEISAAQPCDLGNAVTADQAMAVAAVDPIGIAALPDGSVLILDSQIILGHSQIYHYRLRDMVAPPVALNQIDVGDATPHALLGQDIAFVPATGQSRDDPVKGTLYVADTLRAQTYAFAYTTENPDWAAEPMTQFFPMLRFGGKGLVTGSMSVSYDFDQRWTPLAPQPRARFEPLGVWQLPQRDADLEPDPSLHAFDGKDPGCVWHRLLIDGTIPSGTQIVVRSRAADSKSLVSNAPWNTEPLPYLRATGAEVPYYRPTLDCASDRTGTWELLFQAATGRYLQLQLTFSGDGSRTPRIQSLRAYYPRFSYLTRYLPAVYQDNTASAGFMEHYLANPEGFFTAIEDRIQQVQELFDPRTVPAEYLVWLASWLGISFDFTWGEALRRFFLANAPRFFQTRGTLDGVVRMIRMSLDQCADETLFDPADVQHFSVRIIEHYLLRSEPGIVLGDPTDVQVPGAITSGAKWTPSLGAGPIDQQFRRFLITEYADIAGLNLAWGTSFSGFDDPLLRFPAIQPASAAAAADWSQFIAANLGFTYAQVTDADEPAYQSFLVARYRQIAVLNTAYGFTGNAALSSFFSVRPVLWSLLASGLPTGGVFLQDWILFVSVVLPTRQNAHRFSAIVPVQLTDDAATQMRRQSVAQRVAQQEKPAHTSFDVKLYWAAFRVGQARAGIESVIGPSSRFAAVLLGQSTLGVADLGFVEPWSVRGRIVAGRDQLPGQGGHWREGSTI